MIRTAHSIFLGDFFYVFYLHFSFAFSIHANLSGGKSCRDFLSGDTDLLLYSAGRGSERAKARDSERGVFLRGFVALIVLREPSDRALAIPVDSGFRNESEVRGEWRS